MNFYEYAQIVLTKGIQCIPLNEIKVPALAFRDIPITAEFIEENKRQYLSVSCLGALTRGVWCIDIDRHGQQDGFESLKDNPFYEELQENMSKTMQQTTPSDGSHLIFKKREGVAYSQKIAYLPGVDIKAHENNYFVLAGSMTAFGKYTSNKQPPVYYEGDFEERIFGSPGSFLQQIEQKHSVRAVLPDYDFSHLQMPKGQGGLGKQAYQRIVSGESYNRNEDLFLAASYAKACAIEIEPLKIVIGTTKRRDTFTEREFWKTVNSAMG